MVFKLPVELNDNITLSRHRYVNDSKITTGLRGRLNCITGSTVFVMSDDALYSLDSLYSLSKRIFVLRSGIKKINAAKPKR
jgi:hypothetical protein